MSATTCSYCGAPCVGVLHDPGCTRPRTRLTHLEDHLLAICKLAADSTRDPRTAMLLRAAATDQRVAAILGRPGEGPTAPGHGRCNGPGSNPTEVSGDATNRKSDR